MITKQMEERFKRSDMGKRGDQTEKMLGIEERHKKCSKCTRKIHLNYRSFRAGMVRKDHICVCRGGHICPHAHFLNSGGTKTFFLCRGLPVIKDKELDWH